MPNGVYVVGGLFRKNQVWPIHPLPGPNMKAKPNAQKSSAHRHVSTMHSSRTLTASRDRANPASRNMKPACMKNTRKAVTSVQVVLMALIWTWVLLLTLPVMFVGSVVAPNALTPTNFMNTNTMAATVRMPSIFPARKTQK